MPFARDVLGKAGLPSVSGAMKSLPMPKFGAPIQEPGARFQAIPEGVNFTPPKSFSEIPPTPGTRYANLGKIPGQFLQAPGLTENIVREERDITQKQKETYRAGLSGKQVEVDHIMPIWLGGSGTPENLRDLGIAKHDLITKAQAAIRELYRNPDLSTKYIGRSLDLPEARMWAIRAIDFTPEQVRGLNIGEGGLLKAKNREEAAKTAAQAFNSWNARPSKLGWSAVKDYLQGGGTTGWEALKSILPIPTSWKEAGIALRAGPGAVVSTEESKMAGETIGRGIAQAMPDTAASRAIQGATTAATLGHIPIPAKPTDTAAMKAAHLGGTLFGGLAPFFAGGLALERGIAAFNKVAPGAAAKLFPSAAAKLGEAAKTESASAKYLKNTFSNKRWNAFLKRLPANATVFGVLGQLSRQEENTVEARAKQLAADLGLAGVVSLAKPGITPELGGVWMGSAVIDALAGASPIEAATNATVMTLFHGMGGVGREEPFYRSSIDAANRFTQARLLPGEKPYVPEKMPTTQQEIDSIKTGYESETQKLRSRIESDPNLTPELKESETMNVLLSQHVKYLSTLPQAERVKLAKEDYKSILTYFADNPTKGKGISPESEAAAKIMERLPEESWTSFADEDGVEFETGGVVGEVPQAIVDRINRAAEDGILNRTEDGRLVPDANVKAAVVSRNDVPTPDGGPTGEVILRSPDGQIVSLGLTDEEAKVVIDKMQAEELPMVEAVITEIVPGEHTKIRVKVSDRQLERAKVLKEISGEQKKLDMGDLKKAVSKRPKTTPIEPKNVPARVTSKEGTYEFTGPPQKMPRPPLTDKEIEIAKSRYPAESVAEMMKRDVVKGTLRNDVLPALDDRQLQRAMRETTIAARKPLLERELAGNLRGQLGKLFSEYERRLEKRMIDDPGLDVESDEFRQASIAIDKELERTRDQLLEIAFTPSQNAGIVDPVIVERTQRLQKERGLTPEEAQHGAVKQEVALQMLGVKPKAKFGRDIITRVKKSAKVTSTGPIKTGILRTGERVEIRPKETYAAPGAEKPPTEAEKQVASARGDIESMIANEQVPKRADDIKDYKEKLLGDIETYLSEQAPLAGRKHRLLYPMETTAKIQERTRKLIPTELPGYKGMMKKEIAELRQYGKSLVDDRMREIELSPESEYIGGIGPENSAKQRYEKGLAEGEWTKDQNVFWALRNFYANLDLKQIKSNPVLRYKAEFNPDAEQMEKVWDRLIEDGRVTDTKDQAVKKDFARLWIDGNTDVKNEQLLVIPEVTERLAELTDAEFRPQPEKKVLELSKEYQKKRESVNYTIDEKTRTITNPIARSFVTKAKELRAKGENDLAEFWDSFNKNLYRKYEKTRKSGAPNWFETVLEEPGGLFTIENSLNSQVIMSPIEAEAVMREFAGVLRENNSSSSAAIKDIAKEVSGVKNVTISLVPSDIHGPSDMNVRNIAKRVVGERTGLGRYLLARASNDAETGAVKDFLSSNENTSYLNLVGKDGKIDTKLFDAYIEYHRLMAELPSTDIDAFMNQRYGSEIASKFGIKDETMGDLLDRMSGEKTLSFAEQELIHDVRENEESINLDLTEKGKVQEGFHVETITEPTEFRNKDYDLLEVVTAALGKTDNPEIRSDFMKLSPDKKQMAINRMTDYLANLVTPTIQEQRGREWARNKFKASTEEVDMEEADRIRKQLSSLSQKLRGFVRSGERKTINTKLGGLRKELRSLEGGVKYGKPFEKYRNL